MTRLEGVDRDALTETPWNFTSERAERLVASGRLVLAVASLIAVWIDPSAPSKLESLAYTLLIAYLIYSVVLVVVVWRWATSIGSTRLLTHLIDLAFFTAVIYLTEGATSPFFLYFVFALLSATLRFRLAGTVWTAVAALVIFVGMGLYASLILDDADFEPNRFVIRSVYLGIMAVLLIYLSWHQEKHRRELSRLVAWPDPMVQREESLIRSLLERARAPLGASSVILQWKMKSDVEWRGATLGDQGVRFLEPGAMPVGEPSCQDFYCRDVRRDLPIVVSPGPVRRTSDHETGTRDRVRASFPCSSLMVHRLEGRNVEGFLLFSDIAEVTADEMMLGRIVAEKLASRLDEFVFLQQARHGAVIEERIRVSRELHDGVLQSLTAIALQLRVAERVLGTDPARAIEILGESRRLIVEDQRDLRRFITGLRDDEVHGIDLPLDLRILGIAERARSEWDLHVAVELGLLSDRITPQLGLEVTSLIHEGLANAGKHGNADAIRLWVGEQDDELLIRIADNGRGFPFSGRFALEDLMRMNEGPQSLKERVATLQGDLWLESAPTGSILDFSLPLNLESKE